MAETEKKKRTYDPVKAHEYYMKHRKLKGRKKRSSKDTKGLSEAGKKAAKELQADIENRIQAFNDLVDQKIEEHIKELMKSGNGLSDEEIDKIRENAEKVKAEGEKFYDKMYSKKLKKIKAGK